MKIVMLNGQNHKGSSYNIGRMIADKIQGDNEIKEFFFPKDLDHFCLGCYSCIEDVAACPYYPEKEVIIKAIDEADLLVVTSPTYCMSVSGSLKAFFDLMFDFWMVHRPMASMFRKRAVVVTTSAGSPAKATLKYMEDVLINMGIAEVIKYGLPVQAMNWDGVSDAKKAKIEKDTDAVAAKISPDKKVKPGIKTKSMYSIMKMLHQKGWDSSPVEVEYWKEKGWLDGKKPWDDK